MENVQKNNTTGRRAIFRDQLITIGDLQLFQQELLKNIRRLLTDLNSGVAQAPRWLKTHQAQKVLGCSVGTLLTLRSNGTLPYTKIGGTIFYNADDINRVLQERRRQNGREIPLTKGAKKT